MADVVLVCGAVFDGVGDELTSRREILVRDGTIVDVADRSVDRFEGAQVVDLSDRTVGPGFIDTHFH